MTVFTTYSQKSSTRGSDSQSHENEVNESLSSGAVKNTMKNQRISKMKDIRGFSLIEILTVAGLVAVVGAFSMMIIGPALEARNVEMAVRTVSTQMSRARQFSVDARRRTRVTFITPGTITVDASQGGVWTQVSTVDLPGDMEFEIDAVTIGTTGPPAPTGTYPTTQVAYFANGDSEIFFMPNGSAVDNLGILSNGVVYVAQPSKVETTRAVTLFGSTGKVKRYKYSTGAGWE